MADIAAGDHRGSNYLGGRCVSRTCHRCVLLSSAQVKRGSDDAHEKLGSCVQSHSRLKSIVTSAGGIPLVPGLSGSVTNVQDVWFAQPRQSPPSDSHSGAGELQPRRIQRDQDVGTAGHEPGHEVGVELPGVGVPLLGRDERHPVRRAVARLAEPEGELLATPLTGDVQRAGGRLRCPSSRQTVTAAPGSASARRLVSWLPANAARSASAPWVKWVQPWKWTGTTARTPRIFAASAARSLERVR